MKISAKRSNCTDIYNIQLLLQAATSLREECHKNNIEVISYGSFLLDPKSQIQHLKVRKK